MVKKKELCILHIGMPKTGSSTIQDTFYKVIEDKRVSYGNLPEANQSGRFSGLFMDKPENYHYYNNRGWDRQKIETFKQKNKKLLIEGFTGTDSIIEIISGEDLFHLKLHEIARIKKFLDKYFDNILIVAYVRPVKPFVESAFQQLVKNHYLGSFNFSSVYHKYKNFQNYDNIFGKKNVLLWKFEPKNFPDGDIVVDFCKRLNLEPTFSQEKIVNESLSKEAVSILFTYHFHAKSKTIFNTKYHQINLKLVEKLRPIGKNKFKFSQSIITKIINDNKEDYEWINARMDEPILEIQKEAEENGINSPGELMKYATGFINELVELVEMKNIDFPLQYTPQTVAHLVDKLMIKLSYEVK